MGIFLAEKVRQMLPRWRGFSTTASLGELDLRKSIPRDLEFDTGEFEQRLAEWKFSNDLITARELVSTALVLNRNQEAVDAAEYLMKHPEAINSSTSAIAREILRCGRENGKSECASLAEPEEDEVQNNRIKIRSLKRTLAESPRNSIQWVEISRAYALEGHAEKSKRAMLIALSLSPTNRYVLRSGLRLLVHLGREELAHKIVKSNPLVKVDPWIMAAEMAVAAAANKSPTSIKYLRRALNSSDFSPFDLSEGAAALATQESRAGSRRKAKRLFRQSLEDPTDNTLAQVKWENRDDADLYVNLENYNRLRIFEARALEAYHVLADWQSVIDWCRRWIADEPFSARPAILGSFVAWTALGDASLSQSFSSAGLLANPTHPILLNNETVALAFQGKLQEAEETFLRIDESDVLDINKAAYIATGGLLNFRRQNFDHGISLYREAIEFAERRGDSLSKFLAELHLFQEMTLAGLPAKASIFRDPRLTTVLEKNPVLRAFVRRVGALPEQQGN